MENTLGKWAEIIEQSGRNARENSMGKMKELLDRRLEEHKYEMWEMLNEVHHALILAGVLEEWECKIHTLVLEIEKLP